MADIVQLVENGQKKFLKTHAQAVEGLSEFVEEKTQINEQLLFDGASYFLGGQIFKFDLTKMTEGLHFVYSRYTPGTGPLNYGYITHFIPKVTIESYSAGNFIHPMLNDQFKAVSFDKTSVWGHDNNGIAPNGNYAIRKIWAI